MFEDETYKRMLAYIIEEFKEPLIDEAAFKKKNDEFVAALLMIRSKKSELEAELKGMREALAIFKEEEIKLSLADNIKSLNKLLSLNTNFEQWVKRKFGIEEERLGKEDLMAMCDKEISKNRVLVEEKRAVLRDYTLLIDMKAHIEPLLTYNRSKLSESQIKEEIGFLSGQVQKELTKEKEKIASFIEGQIKSFFYEDLINELYRRIDPHPDYKKIKFVCDFNEDKPKLNVCVYKEDENLLTIPNLYFSTAQLNILSLSIFLAKALNAVDNKGNYLDCIFIDDPIQSMDSINILSTIDLLRSLIVNEKKQIILSTHDENFHSLLRKKMPETLFRSKFMELETFGKLKQVTL